MAGFPYRLSSRGCQGQRPYSAMIRRPRGHEDPSIFWLELEVMRGLEVANRPRLGAHDDRVGGRAAAEEADAFQIVASGDSRRREHHVAANELVERVLALQVGEALRIALPHLVLGEGREARLHVTAGAPESGRGEDTLQPAA